MSELQSLPNIGKIIAKKINKINIKSAEDFLKRDPYDVFDELLIKVDPTLCRCVLASLVGAKNNEKWYTVTKTSAKNYEKMHPNHKWINC